MDMANSNTEVSNVRICTEISDPVVLRLEDCPSLQLPPGLDLSVDRIECWLARTANKECHLTMEIGHPAKIIADAPDGDRAESDDSTAASLSGSESPQSHDPVEHPKCKIESPMFVSVNKGSVAHLDESDVQSHQNSGDSNMYFEAPSMQKGRIFSEVSLLKANSPSFAPSLSDVPQVLVPRQQALLRTKLNSKADAFVPLGPAAPLGHLPFVPMATVVMAWQNWSAARRPDSLLEDRHQ